MGPVVGIVKTWVIAVCDGWEGFTWGIDGYNYLAGVCKVCRYPGREVGVCDM